MNTLQKPIITLLLFIFIGQLFAQKKQLTINDFMNYELYPKRIANMQWLGSSDYYVYEKDNTLFKKHATAEISETVYTIEEPGKKTIYTIYNGTKIHKFLLLKIIKETYIKTCISNR